MRTVVIKVVLTKAERLILQQLRHNSGRTQVRLKLQSPTPLSLGYLSGNRSLSHCSSSGSTGLEQFTRAKREQAAPPLETTHNSVDKFL